MAVKRQAVPFEEALNMTGYGTYNMLVFLLCASVIMGTIFEIFSVSYLVLGSACELGTTSTEQGLVASLPIVGMLGTAHIWGYLADTKGRKRILSICMTMGFLAGTAAAFSPHWIVLCLCKFVSSTSVSGAYALAVTLLGECTPKDKRTLLLLLSTSAIMVSMAIMAVISIPVLPMSFSFYVPYLNIYFNSWRLLDLIYAFPCAISAVGVICAYESPKYLLGIGKDQEALQVLKSIYRTNTRKDPEEYYHVDSLVLEENISSNLERGFWGSIYHQTLPMFKAPLLKHTILLALLFVFNYMCIHSFMIWMPFIVNAFVSAQEEGITFCQMISASSNNISPDVKPCTMNSSAMLMVCGFTLALGVINILMSNILKCVSRKKVFIALQLFCGLACLSLNFIRLWYLIAAVYLLLMMGSINFGFLSSFSVDIYPTHVRAIAVSFTLMTGRGSAIIGINMMKVLLDQNCQLVFYLFGAIAMGGALVGLLLPSDAKLSEQKKNSQ